MTKNARVHYYKPTIVSGRQYSDPTKAPGYSYSTNFPLTENPINENGQWVQTGAVPGLDWRAPQTAGGLAFATAVNTTYDDSIALLGGFNANQRVSAVIHYNGATRTGATDSHEVEIILRGSYTAHVQHLYECNVGYQLAASNGFYMQIMRMDGAIGAFTEIDTVVNAVPTIADGDIFTAEIIGNVINSYINGVKILTATDNTYATGNPGLGFFVRPLHGSEALNDFAFSSFTASNV